MSVGQTEVELEDGIVVLALSGEHDVSTAPGLRAEIERILGSGGDVIVDLSNTEFIDSSIVGVLVNSYRGAKGREDGGQSIVAVAGPNGPVARLFDLVSITELMTVHPTRAAAVAGLNKFRG